MGKKKEYNNKHADKTLCSTSSKLVVVRPPGDHTCHLVYERNAPPSSLSLSAIMYGWPPHPPLTSNGGGPWRHHLPLPFVRHRVDGGQGSSDCRARSCHAAVCG